VGERIQLQRRIKSCTACLLHKQCEGPVPFRGPVPALFSVVGEAPGRQEDQWGKPFIGPAGQLLDEYLTKAGLSLRDAFICNTVSCFPHGTPRREHIEACAQNLRDQLVLAMSPYILILGAIAYSVFKPEASIMRDHGRHWTVTKEELAVTLFPTYHPAAILRNHALKRAWRLDLEDFAALVRQGDHIPRMAPLRYVTRRP
jgi:uracil-DNA glycosylase